MTGVQTCALPICRTAIGGGKNGCRARVDDEFFFMSYLPWHAEAFEAVTARLATLPHALLLTGKAGIGKRPFAHALAGFLLCEQREVKAACGMCQSCRWLAADGHPDFRVIEPEAASSEDGDAEAKDKKKKRDISVAQIRSIGDFIQVSAHRGGGKVVFIHPAEAMNLADRKSTRLNSSHIPLSRMPSSA